MDTAKFYLRRIRGFWNEYIRNKIGIAGIALTAFFVFLALFGPLLTPYNQYGSPELAYKFAMPQWVTIFPQYKDLPPTIKTPLNWSVTQGSEFVDVQLGEELVVNYTGGGVETDIFLGKNFSYLYSLPPVFDTSFRWNVKPVPEGEVGYSIELMLVRWNDTISYSLWDSNIDPSISLWQRNTAYAYTSVPSPYYLKLNITSKLVRIDSRTTEFVTQRFGLEYTPRVLAETIFSQKGEYGLLVHIRFKPNSLNATCKIRLLKFKEFRVLGRVQGILGADHAGGDIWAQLVYGARVSLMIGMTAAAILSFIGLAVGVVSGYVGGVVDEISMRLVDTLICLPVLPLLMGLSRAYGQSVWLIVMLVAAFSWVYLARIIRAQVLTLREMTFIEAAKSMGSGRFHIIARHIVPNVLPTLFAGLVLAIPEAILWEASLSFLGLGDPMLMSWGKMLNNAFKLFGFRNFVWWWILPPGLAIMLTCLGFVFIGHAIDAIVNPRLRRRR